MDEKQNRLFRNRLLTLSNSSENLSTMITQLSNLAIWRSWVTFKKTISLRMNVKVKEHGLRRTERDEGKQQSQFLFCFVLF